MLQFASVDDVYPAQPIAPDVREHRRRKGKKDASENETDQPVKVEPTLTITPTNRPQTATLSSLSPELVRMIPYIAAAIIFVLVGILFDIRNTLKQINDALTRSSTRYSRY